MFKKTDAQRSLMGPEFLLGSDKAERLKRTWAWAFRQFILPMIDEQKFAPLYYKGAGAPCKSVRAQVCLLLFREMFDLTDADAIEQFEWNLLWHHAIDITPDKAHIVRKTLYNFRQRLMASDAPRRFFEDLVGAIVECADLDVNQQRQDSTHIISNVRELGRLGLFVETIEAFLRQLTRLDEEQIKALPERFGERYKKQNGRFADVKSAKSRRRLGECAQDIWFLICRFETDKQISQLKHFKLLRRLFDEQCMVESDDGDDSPVSIEVSDGPLRLEVDDAQIAVEMDAEAEDEVDDVEDEVDPESAQTDHVSIALRPGKSVAADSMQTPHDPDLTYGHKGKGHEVQISETYADKNIFQVLTHIKLTPSCNVDYNALLPALDSLKQRNLGPSVHLVDTGYMSADHVIAARQQEVDLIGPLSHGATNDEWLHRQDFDLKWPSGESVPQIKACPEGHRPVNVDVTQVKDGLNYHARFERSTCAGCSKQNICPVRRTEIQYDAKHPERTYVRHHDPALRSTRKQLVNGLQRKRQLSDEFNQEYRFRAGIEATNSEMKRRHGLANLRVRGQKRVEFDVFMKANAVNVKRLLIAHAAGKLELKAYQERLDNWLDQQLSAFYLSIFGFMRALISLHCSNKALMPTFAKSHCIKSTAWYRPISVNNRSALARFGR